MSQKLYYSIGEVADLFHVNPSLIRFWESEFEQIKPQRNKKGNRLFTQSDIDWFHKIFHLVKEQGYTLQGAKDYLKLPQHSEASDPNFETLKTLKLVRQFLVDLKEKL